MRQAFGVAWYISSPVEQVFEPRGAEPISRNLFAVGADRLLGRSVAAAFTLDEILGNTTELPISEHTTDSHGPTLAPSLCSTRLTSDSPPGSPS